MKNTWSNSDLIKENLKTKKIGRILLALIGTFFFQSLIAIPLLRKINNKCHTIDDLVNLSFNAFSKKPFKYFGWTIQPLQISQELTTLLNILAGRPLRCILEIGTSSGGTLLTLARVANKNATIISVDLPGGKFGEGYPPWKILLYKSFGIRQQKICLLRQNSHNPLTLIAVKKILEGKKLDFLFIDGDHTYEGVKSDFEMYGKLVGKGGIIAFHDIVPGSFDSVGGVSRYWTEIKSSKGYREIVRNWSQGGCGIGVLYV